MHSIKGSPQEKKVISRLVEEIKKFLSSSGAVNINKIRNFRRLQIFVSELPTYQSLFPLNWMHGGRRGQRYYAEDRLRVLNKEKNINYLETKANIEKINQYYQLLLNEPIFQTGNLSEALYKKQKTIERFQVSNRIFSGNGKL